MDSPNSRCRAGTRMFGNLFEPAEIQHRADATLNLTVQRGEGILTHTYTLHDKRGANAVAKESPRIICTTSRPKSNHSLHRPPLRTGHFRRGVALGRTIRSRLAVYLISIDTIFRRRVREFKTQLVTIMNNNRSQLGRVKVFGRTGRVERKRNVLGGLIYPHNLLQPVWSTPESDQTGVDTNCGLVIKPRIRAWLGE